MVSRERHGPWALIVGGSEGIAEALARQLAGFGINLVLVARKSDALTATANMVRALGVEVRMLSLDVSREDTLERIRELTDDIEVGLLVHNVGGGGGFGPFLDRSLEDNMGSVMINCVNVVQLVHHYGQRMKARDSGGIIMFGSMAGTVGGASLATYSAGKAFIQILCESLWAELEGSGIDVVDMVIGSADTPSRRRSGAQDNSLFPVADPEQVARQALQQIGEGPVQVPAGSEQAFARFNIPDRRQAVDTLRRLLLEMSVG